MRHLLLTLMIALTFVVQAEESKCLKAKEVNDIFSMFNFYYSNGEAKIFNPCDANDLATKTVRALIFLQKKNSEKFTTSKVLSAGVFNYFKKRIKNIYYESESTRECQKTTTAYVYQEEKQAMHVCPRFGDFEEETTASSILIHEARHIDGHKHVYCINPSFKKGMSGCDNNYEEQGSYGLGTAYLLSLYRSTQNKVEKQALRSTLVVDLADSFNELPLNIKYGAFVQSKNGVISFFDGVDNTVLFKRKVTDLMTMRSFTPTFYSREGEVQSYVYEPQLIKTAGDFAQRYREEFSDADHKDLLDVYYGEDYSCMLFSSRLECEPTKGHFEIKFSVLNPLKFLAIETGLYLVGEEEKLYPLPPRFLDLQQMSEDDLIKKSFTNPFQSAAVIGNILVAVNGQGSLFITQDIKNPNSSKLAPALNGTRIKNVIGPFPWSKKLEEF